MHHIVESIKHIKRKLSKHKFMKKVITAVFIASSVISPLTPALTMRAYANEPETATVTLMDTDNGTLSFNGTDEKSISVNIGNEVIVNVTPNNGYYADNLTIFDDNDKGIAVEVNDGAAIFTVTGNSTVYATFNENGTVSSDALKAVDIDEQKTFTSVEVYIKNHANKKYVGENDELHRKDVLTVTTTVVDGNKLPNATLNSLWEDTDGDGMSDNYTAMLSQAVSHAVLFEIDPNSDYYVGWAGANISGAKLTDWGAAENNADAIKRTGFIVDDTSGLVYVPKSYTKTDDEGKPMVASSRIQLVYTVDDANTSACFDFENNVSNVDANVASEGKVHVPVASAKTKVTLVKDDASRDSIKSNTIDSVTVNGIEYTSDMNMWFYDEKSGVLEFFMAPAGIHSMSIKMSNSLEKSFVSSLRFARSGGVDNIGTWKFKNPPSVGMSFILSSHNKYWGNKRTPGFTAAVENPKLGNYEDKTIYQALGTEGVNISALVSGRWSLMRGATIHAQSTDIVTVEQSTQLALTCGHVGLNPNFQLDDNYNNREDLEDDLGAHIYVVSVNGNTAIIGVTVPTSHTQAGGGFFEITWEIDEGYARVQKQSANPAVTDGNECYSLEGAEFTVYNGEGVAMGTLTTDANGNTETLSLRPGTYTLRETKTPKGYTTAVDQQFTITGGQTTTITVADPPANDPIYLLLSKYDGENGYNKESNLPQGSASLSGAEFTVEYYATLDYDNYDAIKDAGVKPVRTWVVQTDKDGFTSLSTDHLVSGDALYVDMSNNIIVPRGTIVIYESKAPEGYNLNQDFLHFQKIQETPASSVITYNAPIVPENVIRGGVELDKRDAESGLNAPLGNAASFDGTEFEITSLNDNPVIVDGVTYSKGDVVKVLIIKDGHSSTSNDCLPYGKYSLRESKVTEGYNLNETEYEFTITENGATVNPLANENGIVQNQVKRADFEFSKKAEDTGEHLAGVPFKVTSNTTGESHIVVTDENGYFSSASTWHKHTENTNKNDWALNTDGVIDSSKLDKSAGICFGLTTEGSMTKADDSLCALPYDSYTIEELPCTVNDGYTLIKTSFDITRDSITYDFGTFYDFKPEIPPNGGTYDKTGGNNIGIIASIILLITVAGGLTIYGVHKHRIAGSESNSENDLTSPENDS